MSTMFLDDAEVDAMCEGVTMNAAKTKRLMAMGLIVNRKPNGRPLIVRSHAEAVLSGRAEAAAAGAASAPRPTSGDRAAVIALFSRKAA